MILVFFYPTLLTPRLCRPSPHQCRSSRNCSPLVRGSSLWSWPWPLPWLRLMLVWSGGTWTRWRARGRDRWRGRRRWRTGRRSGRGRTEGARLRRSCCALPAAGGRRIQLLTEGGRCPKTAGPVARSQVSCPQRKEKYSDMALAFPLLGKETSSVQAHEPKQSRWGWISFGLSSTMLRRT